jgi:hypothetical protein
MYVRSSRTESARTESARTESARTESARKKLELESVLKLGLGLRLELGSLLENNPSSNLSTDPNPDLKTNTKPDPYPNPNPSLMSLTSIMSEGEGVGDRIEETRGDSMSSERWATLINMLLKKLLLLHLGRTLQRSKPNANFSPHFNPNFKPNLNPNLSTSRKFNPNPKVNPNFNLNPNHNPNPNLLLPHISTLAFSAGKPLKERVKGLELAKHRDYDSLNIEKIDSLEFKGVNLNFNSTRILKSPNTSINPKSKLLKSSKVSVMNTHYKNEGLGIENQHLKKLLSQSNKKVNSLTSLIIAEISDVKIITRMGHTANPIRVQTGLKRAEMNLDQGPASTSTTRATIPNAKKESKVQVD